MIDALRSLFRPDAAPRSEVSADVAVAALLVDAARADDQYKPEERRAVVALLAQMFGLEHPEAELLREKGEAAQAAAADIVRFTRVVKFALEEDERIRLMEATHDADIVLDLHCDHRAVMHFYASTARPEITDLLGRSTGSVLALIEDSSGGNAFDEAHTAPWRSLQARFGAAVPVPCFSTTLEYRGQHDVSDAVAAKDAEGLLAFLAGVGALTSGPAPAHGPAEEMPLAGAVEFTAPIGGIVTWVMQPGDRVAEGQLLGHVTDPTTRRREDILAPTAGLLFRQELWTTCLKGQGLCHVAGLEIRRQGDLLSD